MIGTLCVIAAIGIVSVLAFRNNQDNVESAIRKAEQIEDILTK